MTSELDKTIAQEEQDEINQIVALFVSLPKADRAVLLANANAFRVRAEIEKEKQKEAE